MSGRSGSRRFIIGGTARRHGPGEIGSNKYSPGEKCNAMAQVQAPRCNSPLAAAPKLWSERTLWDFSCRGHLFGTWWSVRLVDPLTPWWVPQTCSGRVHAAASIVDRWLPSPVKPPRPTGCPIRPRATRPEHCGPPAALADCTAISQLRKPRLRVLKLCRLGNSPPRSLSATPNQRDSVAAYWSVAVVGISRPAPMSSAPPISRLGMRP